MKSVTEEDKILVFEAVKSRKYVADVTDAAKISQETGVKYVIGALNALTTEKKLNHLTDGEVDYYWISEKN